MSLAWGLWEQPSAMTAHLDAADLSRMARSGLAAMGSQEALDLFDICPERRTTPPDTGPPGPERPARNHTWMPYRHCSPTSSTPPPDAHADNDLTAHSKTALAQRLHGLSTEQQQTVLRDLVRSHIATVLGAPTTEDINPTTTSKTSDWTP